MVSRCWQQSGREGRIDDVGGGASCRSRVFKQEREGRWAEVKVLPLERSTGGLPAGTRRETEHTEK